MSQKYKTSSPNELRNLVQEDICVGAIGISLVTDMSWLFCDS